MVDTTGHAGTPITGAYAIEVENLGIRFETLEGSAERGREALEWVREFAVQTPLDLGQTMTRATDQNLAPMLQPFTQNSAERQHIGHLAARKQRVGGNVSFDHNLHGCS